MKPNGRRAWRQWSKRREYKRRRQARKNQVKYSPLMGWNEQRKANDERIRPPEGLAKTLTASDLVGMTMGARKRKARYWMECERLHQKAQDLQEVVDRSVGRKSSLRTIGHTPISLRNHYRIGERLRPCPGCMECDPSGFASICDGSGVLPARMAWTPDAVRDVIEARSIEPEQKELHWLYNPETGEQSEQDYCKQCAEAICTKNNQEMCIDGGWEMESDIQCFCDECGVQLRCSATDYAADEELSHWNQYGPPKSRYDWWSLKWAIATFVANDSRWQKLGQLLIKWGIQRRAARA